MVSLPFWALRLGFVLVFGGNVNSQVSQVVKLLLDRMKLNNTSKQNSWADLVCRSATPMCPWLALPGMVHLASPSTKSRHADEVTGRDP